MRSRVLHRESAGKGVEMSELQAHHCITPEQWSWLLCSVRAIPVNKMLIVRIKSINRNQDADFRFSRNFWFLVQFPGKKMMPVSPLLWMPMKVWK